MYDPLFFLTNLIFGVVCFVMGICFLAFPIPQKEGLKNYRISLKVLALAYFLISFFTTLLLFLKQHQPTVEIIYFNFLIITASQTLLFGFTLTTLFDPDFVNLRKFFYHTLPIFIIVALFAFSFFMFGNPHVYTFTDIWRNISQPTINVRLLLLVYDVFQLFFYMSMFLKAEKIYKDKINNYFSESRLSLNWVRYALFSGVSIGVLSLILPLFPYKYFNYILNVIFTLFYLVFAIKYINYPQIYLKLEEFFTAEEVVTSKIASNETIEEVVSDKIASNQKGRLLWADYKTPILEEKLFLKKNINIEELASWLKIGRTTLSGFINSEEKMNFNTWINTLRVEEAKNLLLNNPVLSISDVSEKVGYTEHSNFSRIFKQITGESPLLWKQNHLQIAYQS